MSAVDWRPGPRLRAAMDADKVLPRMVRDELGGYGLTVRRFGLRKLFATGATAQEAADNMERIIGGEEEEKIEAAQKLIDEARAELTAMREKAAAPRNWPERIDAGMVFRHRGGAVYVWAHDRCQELVCIVTGGESRCGDVFDKDLARACMDSFSYLGHARDLIKIANDAHEPTGAELVGNVCQVSLHPISEPNDGIRCLVTSFDPIIGYRTKEGETMPWKYARLAR